MGEAIVSEQVWDTTDDFWFLTAILGDSEIRTYRPTARQIRSFLLILIRLDPKPSENPFGRSIVEEVERATEPDQGPVSAELIARAAQLLEACHSRGQERGVDRREWRQARVYYTIASIDVLDEVDGACPTWVEVFAGLLAEHCSKHFGPWDLAARAPLRIPPEINQPFHDIFPNPFRPVTFAPEWRTEAAVGIASQMYDSRDFGNMPILADALQDAGCEHADILAHCRDSHGVHVRGCWVVDLVLGKS